MAVLSLSVLGVVPSGQGESFCAEEAGLHACATTHELQTQCSYGGTAWVCVDLDIKEPVATYYSTYTPLARIDGYLEVWRMDLPLGASQDFFCITLLVDEDRVSPCESAGLRFIGVVQYLFSAEPGPVPGNTSMHLTLAVYEADLTIRTLGAQAQAFQILVPSVELFDRQWCSGCLDRHFGLVNGTQPIGK